jgi:pyruvate,orthophosphate dikinase
VKPSHLLLLDGSDLPDRNLIGGKAWSIARMSALGLSVPPAFVITTEACAHVLEHGEAPADLDHRIDEALQWLESQTGRSFGTGPQPLLVSVRSGAPISMPGMMDTVLNLGITDQTEEALARECQDASFARDTHRRFIELYANIVLKSPVELHSAGTPEEWRQAAAAGGEAVPQEPREQLRGAISAVFNSWNSRRARRYRQHHGIADTLGTAVTVQAMVFGNLDERSGTGVLFSRNPLTGERQPYGEFLRRAQGEDIVSGKHTPMPLDDLRTLLPDIHTELLEAAEMLEARDGDVQDIEFTLERGKLFFLQTRVAKRAPAAALRIARDMVDEARLSPADALRRLSSEQIRVLLSPKLAKGATDNARVIASGEAASPGIGYGVVVTDSNEAERLAQSGVDVILARATTSPDDLHGMIAARAIITEHGGSTSHAAVVGRSLGRPCVTGCGSGSLAGLGGADVTVDGGSGKIYSGRLEVMRPSAESDDLLRAVTGWATDLAPLAVTEVEPANGFIDFDTHTEDYRALFANLARGAVVRGAIFANDDGAVQCAVDAGVSTIVTSPALPALVAAAQTVPHGIRKEVH